MSRGECYSQMDNEANHVHQCELGDDHRRHVRWLPPMRVRGDLVRAFDFDRAIGDAQKQIDSETVMHEKRMEFWKGYRCAMEETKRHFEESA